MSYGMSKTLAVPFSHLVLSSIFFLKQELVIFLSFLARNHSSTSLYTFFFLNKMVLPQKFIFLIYFFKFLSSSLRLVVCVVFV